MEKGWELVIAASVSCSVLDIKLSLINKNYMCLVNSANLASLETTSHICNN